MKYKMSKVIADFIRHAFYIETFHFSGRGLGFFVTGKLFDPFTGLGGRWTFRFYSLLALSVLIIYASTNLFASKYSRRTNKEQVQHQKKGQLAGKLLKYRS